MIRIHPTFFASLTTFNFTLFRRLWIQLVLSDVSFCRSIQSSSEIPICIGDSDEKWKIGPQVSKTLEFRNEIVNGICCGTFLLVGDPMRQCTIVDVYVSIFIVFYYGLWRCSWELFFCDFAPFTCMASCCLCMLSSEFCRSACACARCFLALRFFVVGHAVDCTFCPTTGFIVGFLRVFRTRSTASSVREIGKAWHQNLGVRSDRPFQLSRPLCTIQQVRRTWRVRIRKLCANNILFAWPSSKG